MCEAMGYFRYPIGAVVTDVNRGVQTTGIFPDILMIWEDSPSCALGRFTFSVWGQNRKLGLRETFETGQKRIT